MATRPQHNGRTTDAQPKPGLSRATLEFCDWLIDGVTLAANHPDFDNQAAIIGRSRREIGDALRAAGGSPITDQRQAPTST